jgi:hypothetical protein
MEAKARSAHWPLSLPKVYKQGKIDELWWLTTEYVDGTNGAENPDLLELSIGPVAAVIAKLIRLDPAALSGLRLQPRRPLRERVRERLFSYSQRIGTGILGSELVPLLLKSVSSLQSAPIRGDLGIGNILQDKHGGLWLVDSEFASPAGIKFYDVGYFYFRLGVNADRIDLAERFMSEFRKVYSITNTMDEMMLRWSLVYRLLGGYFEALNNDSLYNKIADVRRLIEKQYWPV